MEQARGPSQSNQLQSLRQCLHFENKKKHKQLLDQYNCSDHLQMKQAAAQMTPPQLTFL